MSVFFHLPLEICPIQAAPDDKPAPGLDFNSWYTVIGYSANKKQDKAGKEFDAVSFYTINRDKKIVTVFSSRVFIRLPEGGKGGA